MSQEITADTIGQLFVSQRIKCRGLESAKGKKMLEDLAAEVSFLRLCFERESVIANEAQAKLEQHLEGLLKEIPAVIQTNIDMAEIHNRYGESKSAQAANKERERLVKLQGAAQDVMENGIGWRVFPPTETWHDFAVSLADDFRNAMHSVDSTLKLRPSNVGPIAKFLEAAIPLITGETPRMDAIGRHLQREEDEGNTTDMPASSVKAHNRPYIRQE
jgi:hypothetical protein